MKKPIHKFSITREALDCSQDQLAVYLGITRSFLGNIENGYRVMPGEAELRLLHIYETIVETTPAPDTEPIPVESKAINEYRADLENQFTRQQQKVATIIANRQSALYTLQCIEKISAKASPDDTNLHLFMNSLRANAQLKLTRNSSDKLALEQLKLKACQAAREAVNE